MAAKEVSDDLDNLLDEALADFDKVERTKKAKKKPEVHQPTERELEQMFADLSSTLDSKTAQENVKDLLPFMEQMMKSLLSKEVLYPPLKDLREKYPDWLADNRQSLPEPDYQRFNRQYQVTKLICEEFESNSEPKFDRVFDLMQQMQGHGHPPEDLIGKDSELFKSLDPDNCFDAKGDLLPPNECKQS